MKQVRIAIGLFVETGLLAQHGPGQPIDLVIRSGGIGHQGGGDGEGRGCLEVARVDACRHLAALVIPDPFEQLVPYGPLDRQEAHGAALGGVQHDAVGMTHDKAIGIDLFIAQRFGEIGDALQIEILLLCAQTLNRANAV